jgi:hypothetical protein
VAGNKGIPRVQNPPQGDGHHVTYRYMTATELAERNARQNAYDAMLARQEAFERSREVAVKKTEPVRAGCVFAKSCKLPDAIIDYSNPAGMVPTDSLKDYGELILLGAREADESGAVPLKKIGATAIPVGFGSLALANRCLKHCPLLYQARLLRLWLVWLRCSCHRVLATVRSIPTNNCVDLNRRERVFGRGSNSRPTAV